MQDYSNQVPVSVIKTPSAPGNGQGFYAKNKLAIWAIAASLVVIGVIVAVIFHKPAVTLAPKVTLQIAAPAQISTSTDTVYTVTIANSDTASIKSVSVDMLYPSGFTFESSSPNPANTSGTSFTVNQVDPGQNGVIVIKGKTQGNDGQVQQVNAVMHYQFSNFNSDFIAQAQAQSQISSPGIALQVNGPTQANNGQSIVYSFAYSDSSGTDTSGLTMKITLPTGFTPAKYSLNPVAAPDPTTGVGTWNLPALSANGSGQVQVTGTFTGVAVGSQENFSVEIDRAGAVSAATTYQVSIAASTLSASLALTEGGTSVDPNSEMYYKVTYQNSGSTVDTGVVLTATLTGAAYDITSLNAPYGNISGSTITWDGSQVSQLAALQAGQKGTLLFNVRIKNPATKANVKDMTVSAHTEIRSDQVQQAFVGDPVATKVNTQLTLDTTAAVNSGPNPPQAGSATGYMAVLSLRNTTSDVSNVSITMTLPQAYNFDPTLVTLTEQKNVVYSANTRKLIWNVGTVSAHTGDYNPVRKLTLMVSVLPDQTSIGRILDLVTNIQVTGTDAFTGNQISFASTKLTTSSDPSGNGAVVQ